MRELATTLTDAQLDLLVLLADKNALGGVDYAEFISVYGPAPPAAVAQTGMPPPAPPAQPCLPAAPPGMPPVNFSAPSAPSPISSSPSRPAAQAPPGMPPVGAEHLHPPANTAAATDFGMTLTMGDINAMTFFTCASGGDMLGR